MKIPRHPLGRKRNIHFMFLLAASFFETSLGYIKIDNVITEKWNKLQNYNIHLAQTSTQKQTQYEVFKNGLPFENERNITSYTTTQNTIVPQNISKNVDIPNEKTTKQIKHRYIPFSYRSTPKVNVTVEECMGSSHEDFPEDLFTMKQKREGAVFLHFVLGVYCFALLAVVCNDYFLPSVELICEKLHLSQDVAAATFMAIATSAPEFFVNLVGTFVTESDIGVGTIVGSAMFNTLGVAALGGLAASTPIKIDWWPITRDSIIYVCTITMLVLMSKDEKIQWYESLILLVFYVVYFFVMWANKGIYNFIMKIMTVFKKRTRLTDEQGSTGTVNSFATQKTEETIIDNFVKDTSISIIKIERDHDKALEVPDDAEQPFQLFKWPGGSRTRKVWWIFSWPVRLLLTLTIPDCRRYPKLFPLTFVMCVVWIGMNSYIVSWMITVIGATLRVPDFVMGVTFLAAGGCLPEAISIFIVSRKGEGGMGVSNSLGANTLDILLCLGLPWFIKSMIGASSGKASFIPMGSDSLFYTIIALILAVLVLYGTVSMAGYKLNRKVGVFLAAVYLIFLTMAIVFEMYLLTEDNLKPCPT